MREQNACIFTYKMNLGAFLYEKIHSRRLPAYKFYVFYASKLTWLGHVFLREAIFCQPYGAGGCWLIACTCFYVWKCTWNSFYTYIYLAEIDRNAPMALASWKHTFRRLNSRQFFSEAYKKTIVQLFLSTAYRKTIVCFFFICTWKNNCPFFFISISKNKNWRWHAAVETSIEQ